MKPISDRALLVLCAIDQRCQSARNSTIRSFWVPNGSGRGCDDWSDEIQDFVNIGGAGDARILKSLESAGLIERPKTTLPQKYVYGITEDGRLAIEQARESGRLDKLRKNS